jgi:16S rRNA (adenine1518-N6/adenine1519-N6)-dimethyltransferase
MTFRRPPWKSFKEALAAQGFHPSKRFGQNFLLDENTAAAIVSDAGVQPGDFVLEIGVGCGFLSVQLLGAGANLLGVEIDRRLFGIASDFLDPLAPDSPGGSLELVRADALAKKRAIAPEILERIPADSNWHLVSNLPYSVASPILVSLSRLPNPPRVMTALIQTEVAERIVASPGTSAWGGLTAKLGLLYNARLARRVGPGLFWPPPKVESAVVRLELKDTRLTPEKLEGTDRLIEALFQARRKTLRAVVGRVVGSKEGAVLAMEAIGIDPGARAETLDLGQLQALADSVGSLAE